MTRDGHMHLCGVCGASWPCCATDCFWDDACRACEDAALAVWAASVGYTISQPPLEPETALLAAKDEQ